MNPTAQQFEVRRTIAADHPCLPGHFPGDPIVPGAVILDEVTRALREWRQSLHLTGIPAVKFLAPLRPEQQFAVIFSARSELEFEFSCHHEGQVIARGRLTCQN